jgi:rubrerythrin
MAIQDRNLVVGTRLVARYRKQTYVCTVEAGEGDEGVAYVLEDGKRFKSPSAAGSHIMGGKAVNGWRFWSLEGEAPEATEAEEKPAKAKGRKPRKLLFKVPNQAGAGAGNTRWFCSACMGGFVAEGEDEPQVCPKGHRIDDPELTAPAAEAEVTA